jgi:hypothetical protein
VGEETATGGTRRKQTWGASEKRETVGVQVTEQRLGELTTDSGMEDLEPGGYFRLGHEKELRLKTEGGRDRRVGKTGLKPTWYEDRTRAHKDRGKGWGQAESGI